MINWILSRPHLLVLAEWVSKWKWLLAAFGFAIAAILRLLPAPLWLLGLLLLIGAALVGVPILADQVLKEEKTIEADYYRNRLGQVLGDVIVPISEKIGQIAKANGLKDKRELKASLTTLIVGTAAKHLGEERARAMYYELDGTSLVLRDFLGRGDRPRSPIVLGRNNGTEIHKMVRTCKAIHMTDLPEGKEYRSFVSVSVFVGNRAIGMLNIDSPGPNDIAESHVAYAKALAQLLAAGLSI